MSIAPPTAILIAEDSPTQAHHIREVLEGSGYAVELAMRGDEALEVARAGPFALVLSDVMMPGLSGYELCRALKGDDRTRGIPVMLLTSLDDPTDVLDGIEAGADSYLTKPFEPEDLLHRIRTLLERGLALRGSISTSVKASFMGRQFHLSFDGAQLVEFFLTSFEDYIRARARQADERRAREDVATTLAFVESTFDALQIEVAIFDEEARIVAVNAAWRRAVEGAGADWQVGGRYLDALAGVESEEAERVREGIERMLLGPAEAFAVRGVPCDKERSRFCNVSVSRFDIGGERRLVLAHDDVTLQTFQAMRRAARFGVTRTLAGSDSLEEAAPALLRTLCEGCGFVAGELWRCDGERASLLSVYRSGEDEALAAFFEASRPVQFVEGEGLAGLVWQQRHTVWVRDLRDEPRLAGREQALRVGLRCSVAVPLLYDDRIVGVLHLFAKRIRDEEPEVVGMLEDVADQIGQFVDRCEAKNALEEHVRELARSESRQREQAHLLQAVLDSVTDGIAVVNPEGEIVRANPAAERISGKRVRSAPPEAWSEAYGLFSADGARMLAPEELPLFRALRGGTAAMELLIRNEAHPQGVPAHVTGAPVVDELGKQLGSVAVIRDLTLEKRAREELEKKEEQLRQSQKMDAIGRLAGGIAHDFNNLLTAILSFGAFALETLEPESTAREDIEEVLKAGRRAEALTRQLLAFSRRSTVEPRLVNLREVVADTDKLLGRLLGAHISLLTRLDDGLWNVTIDPGSFEQVLVNLAVNARDAMPSGGALTLEASNVTLDETFGDAKGVEVPPGDYVMVAVSDEGEGIAPELRDTIFEPFFTTKARGRGTGLGLSTCYGIIKQARGYIWVYSEVGVGTTFKIYLPRSQDGKTERTPTPPAEELEGNEDILLAEDDEMVRAPAVRALRRAGFTVTSVADGAAALEIVRNPSHTIDLMITDMVMPGMSGRDLADEAAKLRPHMPVLYTSGYTEDAVLRRGAETEGITLLPKPFTPRSLLAKVRSILDSKAAGNEEES